MPAPAGSNPGNRCQTETVDTCGFDGTCDGAGACRQFAAGTECAPATCSKAELIGVSRCDGMGTCVPPDSQSCKPFVCGSDKKCGTSCTVDADCVSPITCKMGTCGALPAGAPCGTSDSACDSKMCRQGACCATECTGGCKSCSVKGSEGTCTPIPGGMPAFDPDPTMKTCPVDPSPCGTDGTCDGAGKCRLTQLGKMCSQASCANAALRPAGTCDGKGTCQVPAAVTCGGYTCGTPMSCRTTCAADPDCAAPSVCGADHACGGLSAQYFTQLNLTNMVFMRTDPNINFNWGGGSPSPNLPIDNFAVRWRGKITARFSEMYTFFAATDDGERLWVGGRLLIDHFIRHASVPEDVSPAIGLVAGQPVDIVMEYFENGGDASAQLSWQSKSEPKAIVPTSALAPQ